MLMRPTDLRLLALITALLAQTVGAGENWVHYSGRGGPGQGKHIVLVSGDEEYRSEEALPQLAKILAVHHGFDCTVLFAIDPQTGTIDPDNQTNIPGIQKLADADMLVIATRFRELPDEDMKYVDEFVNSAKPILGLRTATHAFHYSRNKQSPYAHYDFGSQTWTGGFGQQVLGDTWINHHGHHGRESTRGIINPVFRNHPILRGVGDVWGPTDVYGIRNLPDDADVLMFGQVLQGMNPDDPPVTSSKNDPMMPLFWTRTYEAPSGETSRIACTTMGASQDLLSAGLRRALVNACYWGLTMDDLITGDSNVEIVGTFEPTKFGFHIFRQGVKPADYELVP